jgi:hypothetical protein
MSKTTGRRGKNLKQVKSVTENEGIYCSMYSLTKTRVIDLLIFNDNDSTADVK